MQLSFFRRLVSVWERRVSHIELKPKNRNFSLWKNFCLFDISVVVLPLGCGKNIYDRIEVLKIQDVPKNNADLTSFKALVSNNNTKPEFRPLIVPLYKVQILSKKYNLANPANMGANYEKFFKRPFFFVFYQ